MNARRVATTVAAAAAFAAAGRHGGSRDIAEPSASRRRWTRSWPSRTSRTTSRSASTLRSTQLCSTRLRRRTTHLARSRARPTTPTGPPSFGDVVVKSGDGTLLTGKLALRPGVHPGVVVVHGFNTNAKESVVRWAAMLARNGFNVLAADQRDFKAESDAGYGYPGPRQTFGWKEAEDVLAAGRFLASQPGVSSVGPRRLLARRPGHGARTGARRCAVEEQARVLGRDELQRAGRPGDAGLQHRRPGRLRDAGVHLSGNRCADGARRAAVHLHGRVHRARRRGGVLRRKPVLDLQPRERLPPAGEGRRAATQPLLRRRLARRRLRGADDGGLRRRQSAAADRPARARRARLLLRPLVAAAGDPPLLQEPASGRVRQIRWWRLARP